MPIHEKKECPNRIIISSNMGIGNLVKETLPPTPYKEKHKCISVSAQTRPTSVQTKQFLFFPRPGGHTHATTQTQPAPARMDKFFFFFFFFTRPQGRDQLPRRWGLNLHGHTWVHTDGVLPRVDVVKTCPQVKLRLGGKN
jgi:hypothetical protein